MRFHEKDQALRDVFRGWWNGLTDAPNGGLRRQRGPLAELRRIDLVGGAFQPAPDAMAALTLEAFRDLVRAIDPIHSLHGLRDDRIEDLVAAAAALARIRTNLPRRTTAGLLGGRKDEDRKMKEARFLALMRVQTSADLFDQARRLPDLLGGEAPVGELGASLLLWRSAPSVRRDWARDYYHLDLDGRERRDPETPGPAPADAGA